MNDRPLSSWMAWRGFQRAALLLLPRSGRSLPPAAIETQKEIIMNPRLLLAVAMWLSVQTSHAQTGFTVSDPKLHPDVTAAGFGVTIQLEKAKAIKDGLDRREFTLDIDRAGFQGKAVIADETMQMTEIRIVSKNRAAVILPDIRRWTWAESPYLP